MAACRSSALICRYGPALSVDGAARRARRRTVPRAPDPDAASIRTPKRGLSMKLKRKVPVVLMAAAALTVTACAQSDRDSGSGASGSTGGGSTKDTFTFGAAGAPKVFDPFYATDGETFRVTRQIHQGLLGVKPGTADIQPELAE